MIKESSIRVEIVHTQCQCEDPNEGFQPDKNERSDEGYILAPVHVLAMDASKVLHISLHIQAAKKWNVRHRGSSEAYELQRPNSSKTAQGHCGYIQQDSTERPW